MKNYIIGIDPGLSGSGMAIYNIKTCKYELIKKLDLDDLFSEIKIMNFTSTFLIEDANLGKTASWHKGGKGAVRNVGKNMAVATLIISYCEKIGADYVALKPEGYTKYFEQHSPQIQKQLLNEITDLKFSSNKETRAAIAIIEKNIFRYKN